jgi:hypothetical protein
LAGSVFSLAISSNAQTTASCSFSYFTPPSPYNAAFQANGINHYGTVVGGASSTTVVKGFIHTSGTSLYSVPNSPYTELNKRNYYGTSVGFYLPATGAQPIGLILASSGTRASLKYPGASATILNGINKSNVIVGSYRTTPYAAQNGFRYSGGTFTKIHYPNSVQTVPEAINDNGVIVGEYWLSSLENDPHGFIYHNGTYATLTASSGNTQITDVSNGLTLVVGPNLLYKSGVWKKVVAPNASETFVRGINDLGVVAGVANYQGANNTFTWKAFKATCN